MKKLDLILVFLLGAFSVLFLYLGLPFDFTQDLVTHDSVLANQSYKELLSFALSPFTPAWFYMTEIGYLRPIYYLIVKSFIDVFGLVLWPIHAAVALGAGVLACLIFALTSKITGRKLFGWLVTIFYLTIPTNAEMIVGFLSADLQYWHSCVVLGAVFSFAYVVWSPRNQRNKFFAFVGWILLTWIAIKWKSSEKLLPVIYLAFLLLRMRWVISRLGAARFGALLGINLLMFILVIPIKMIDQPKIDYGIQENVPLANVYTPKDATTLKADPKNIYFRTIVNPGHENPLTNLMLDKRPNTFTGIFGFFLGWFFWIGLLASPLLWRKTWPLSEDDRFIVSKHLMQVLATWFFITVGSFALGAPLSEVRFLNFAIVPALILLAFEIKLFDAYFGSMHRIVKQCFHGFLILAFVFVTAQNTAFLLKWVAHFGGIQHALVESEKTIYRSYFQEEPTLSELFHRHKELEQKAVLVGWYDLPSDWIDFATQRINQQGVLFYKVRTDDDEALKQFQDRDYQVTKVGDFYFNEADPIFFRLWHAVSKQFSITSPKKNPKIVVYQITPGSTY